nr:hypothetical protein [Tanacetum cinerariifolium]
MKTEVSNYFVDKKYFEIEKKELILKNDRLLEHIICQDVMNVVRHADVHNLLSSNNNYLDNDNLALELLKMENDFLRELLISQDLMHATVNFLAAINDYKSMEQSFLDEYEENLKPQTELDKKNDMIKKAVYTELSDRFEQARALKPLDNALNYAFYNANVKYSVLNVKFELICATFHKCMFDAIHDLFICDYLNDVNARVKSKSVKSKLLFPRFGSTTLACKVIVTLNKFKAAMRETLL